MFSYVSNRMGRISFINLDYCLLRKNASDRLELSISVDLFMEANNMNPDQTASKGAV